MTSKMDYSFLSTCKLFTACSPELIEKELSQLSPKLSAFAKGETIYFAGDQVQSLGLILKGSVQIENIDIMGNTNILGISQAGDVFAEAYAIHPTQPLLVDVVAREACEILFLSVPRIMEAAGEIKLAALVQRNLLRIGATKNINLSMRIFHSSPKHIRDRLISYFSQMVTQTGSYEITIPFNRQQLADYLGVDRVALSKELGKMRDDGLLEFRKNVFHLHMQDLV